VRGPKGPLPLGFGTRKVVFPGPLVFEKLLFLQPPPPLSVWNNELSPPSCGCFTLFFFFSDYGVLFPFCMVWPPSVRDLFSGLKSQVSILPVWLPFLVFSTRVSTLRFCDHSMQLFSIFHGRPSFPESLPSREMLFGMARGPLKFFFFFLSAANLPPIFLPKP